MLALSDDCGSSPWPWRYERIAPRTTGKSVTRGGANSAGQAAVYFSGYAKKVTMLVRGDSLTKSMSLKGSA